VLDLVGPERLAFSEVVQTYWRWFGWGEPRIYHLGDFAGCLGWRSCDRHRHCGRRSARFALYAALAVSVFYAIAGTIILPRLWIDPLGPLVKIFPIMVLNLVALAILKDR
jgi:DoxX-like protein